ncbi:SDR family NAD(P)-dependent oxidoreductase [Conexibacter sp. W3-3-2]|uniref:SDR family NAD(P)-dependent oxidoreductase n=1 Tax=Conexibacter sp. W3-3-2 TaxID=2675227 RepID=UPI0012B81388|nr:SDR family NAD(P)-dependent oxidoreductase [Conexibacter sp. W3-3-2]MTD47765.1 SDR family NAD(P)-dependent oxidoreductase [Conexibacter sp. W3-3-2]
MSTARDRWIGKPTGNESLWRWGLEADPGRQIRRLARAARGESTESQLRRAVAGRTVLVTGASAGIGREVACRLGAVGAELLLVARRRDRLEELADELRGTATVHVLPCDLMDLDAVDALAARVLAQHGSVDVLVNNAGHSIRRAVWRQTDRLHDFERVMRLNYFAALHLTLPLVAEMRRRGDGHVVNVSTLGTQFGPEPRFAGYLGSKGALDAFARSAAAETGRDGVHWTTVHMPLVRTDMITPTHAFREFPALSPPRAAEMVIDGIIRRPVRVSHPYGIALHTVDLIAPRRLERAMGEGDGPQRITWAGRRGR